MTDNCPHLSGARLNLRTETSSKAHMTGPANSMERTQSSTNATDPERNTGREVNAGLVFHSLILDQTFGLHHSKHDRSLSHELSTTNGNPSNTHDHPGHRSQITFTKIEFPCGTINCHSMRAKLKATRCVPNSKHRHWYCHLNWESHIHIHSAQTDWEPSLEESKYRRIQGSVL